MDCWTTFQQTLLSVAHRPRRSFTLCSYVAHLPELEIISAFSYLNYIRLEGHLAAKGSQFSAARLTSAHGIHHSPTQSGSFTANNRPRESELS